MKLSEFLGFGKKKVNLTPDVAPPDQRDLFFTKPLREYALTGAGFEGKGYGPDFLSKATNPVIANKEAMFREQTLPGIASQLSSRGVARSAGMGLSTDMYNRAEQAKNRDIDELMSKFYVLNEQQKKTDQSQMLRTAGGLQDQEAQMLADKAAASERQVGRNVAQTNAFNSDQDIRQQRTIGAVLGAMTGGAGGAGLAGVATGAATGYSGGGIQLPSTGGKSGARQSILGADDSGLGGFSSEDLSDLLYELRNQRR